MTITAVFESIGEMKDFADLFCRPGKEGKEEGGGSGKPQEAAPVSAPQAQPQPYQVRQAAPPAPGAVPTTAQPYTLDDLARAAMTLMDSGRQIDLQQLLSQFGVEALPALPQAQYGAFATALRGMGAQI